MDNVNNSNMPKISVVTICYNTVTEIEKTLISVINQSYPNMEYIVIDGGSTDGTVDIIRKYADRIAVFISETDNGIYDAMNKGIRYVTGDWVCFINSGDLFFSKSILDEVFMSEYDAADILYGDVVLDYSEYGLITKKMDTLKANRIPLDICHQSTFTKASVLKKYLYDTSFEIYADINTFYLMWKDGYKYHYVPKSIAIFEGFGGISSTKLFQCLKESMKIQNNKWYNSTVWWCLLVEVCAKKIVMIVFGQKKYNRFKFKKVSKRFSN